jgi:hypothetical protein
MGEKNACWPLMNADQRRFRQADGFVLDQRSSAADYCFYE